MNNRSCVPDTQFVDTDGSQHCDGSVQFTREVDELLFGLDVFFRDVKKGRI